MPRKKPTITNHTRGEALKTYILETPTGVRHVSVPAHWRLTFGPTCPYSKDGPSRMSNKWSLRFYENSKDNLRAIFTDVVAFRDKDIRVMERRTEVERRVVAQDGAAGGKNVVVEARITKWVDPDDDENLDNAPARALLEDGATAAREQAERDTNLFAKSADY